MTQKAIVTGGAGFIGAHVSRELIENGIDVVVLDDLSGGFADNLPEGAEFVQGSVLDHELIDRLFDEHHFDFVFHLAAYAAEVLCHHIRRYNYTNNLVGSVNLINPAIRHDVKCFVFTSSIAVYGSTPPPMKEDDHPQPEDPYGIAKLAVEMDLKAANQMYGLPYVIFRPHNVYGELQNIGDRYRNVIGIFMNQIMQQRPMTIFGDGEQTRAFSYVGDVAPIIARAPFVADAHGEVFNVGAHQPYSINQLANVIAAAMGVEPDLSHVEARHEVAEAYCSHGKVERVFDCTPQFSLEEGVGRMADWARTVGRRSGEPFRHIEVERGLPASWRST
jgi:UDP-glucose 4-epimerase